MNLLKKLFTPNQAVNFKDLKQKGAVIIDVRTIAEFNSGHLKNTLNIPLNTIPGQLVKIKKYNKPVITVCRSGSRSGMATGILKRAGIEAYNGGAWDTLENKIK